jgi:hypothetical protein
MQLRGGPADAALLLAARGSAILHCRQGEEVMKARKGSMTITDMLAIIGSIGLVIGVTIATVSTIGGGARPSMVAKSH